VGFAGTFLKNLFTCAEGIGNPVYGMFGISPPTVAEYLLSANNVLFIPVIAAQGDGNNFGNVLEDNHLYYHLASVITINRSHCLLLNILTNVI
jgi:hypothetical protein